MWPVPLLLQHWHLLLQLCHLLPQLCHRRAVPLDGLLLQLYLPLQFTHLLQQALWAVLLLLLLALLPPMLSSLSYRCHFSPLTYC